MVKIKINPEKALSIGVTVLGVLGTVLSSVVHKNEQQALKSELKEELIKELTESKN